MTRHGLVKLAALALDVSNGSPERWDRYGVTSYVRRDLINLIRQTLSAEGIDWRAQRRAAEEQRKAQGRRR